MTARYLCTHSGLARWIPYSVAIATIFQAGLLQAQGMALEEIIVTAQKKLESAQDVPATVNPITDEALQKFTILEIDQLSSLAPGISFERPDSRRQSFTIRGVTADPDSTAAAPITSYWNEQPIEPQQLFTALYDLARIEVLRGPQGTLRGRTDPAGSILIYTQKPNRSSVEGYVQQTFSDNHGSNTQAAVSVPVIEDRLAVRVSGLYDDNDGQEIRNISTGQKELSRQKSGRFSLSWLPLDTLEVDFTYQYLELRNDTPEALEGAPGAALLDPASDYSYLLSAGTATQYPPGFSLDKKDRRGLYAGLTRTTMRDELLNLTLSWEVGNHILTSVTGYTESTQTDDRDLDVAQFWPGGQRSYTEMSRDKFTQELRIANTSDDFWEYNAGLYYEKRETYATNVIDMAPFFGFLEPFTGFPVQTASMLLQIPLDVEVKAVFLHNKFYLTDKLNLQFGVRYQEIETQSLADAISEVDGSAALADLLELPNRPLILPHQSRQKDDAWTGTLKLSYELTPDIMLYGGYDRSFRPSGVTIAGNALSSENLVFDSETSNNFELGVKTTLADGRVRLNAAVFHQSFDGYQAFATNIAANLPRSGSAADESNVESLTFNADTRIRGFEADFEALLSERWIIGGGYTYVDSRFKSGEQGPCNQSPVPAGRELSSCDIGGNRISIQPLWSANLNSEYHIPFGGMEWYLRGLYSYSDRRVDELVAGDEIPAYGILNMWTGLRSSDGAWDVSLWVKNLTDEQEKALSSNRIAVQGLGVESDFRRAVMIAPRTFGITGRYSF